MSAAAAARGGRRRLLAPMLLLVAADAAETCAPASDAHIPMSAGASLLALRLGAGGAAPLRNVGSIAAFIDEVALDGSGERQTWALPIGADGCTLALQPWLARQAQLGRSLDGAAVFVPCLQTTPSAEVVTAATPKAIWVASPAGQIAFAAAWSTAGAANVQIRGIAAANATGSLWLAGNRELVFAAVGDTAELTTERVASFPPGASTAVALDGNGNVFASQADGIRGMSVSAAAAPGGDVSSATLVWAAASNEQVTSMLMAAPGVLFAGDVSGGITKLVGGGLSWLAEWVAPTLTYDSGDGLLAVGRVSGLAAVPAGAGLGFHLYFTTAVAAGGAGNFIVRLDTTDTTAPGPYTTVSIFARTCPGSAWAGLALVPAPLTPSPSPSPEATHTLTVGASASQTASASATMSVTMAATTTSSWTRTPTPTRVANAFQSLSLLLLRVGDAASAGAGADAPQPVYVDEIDPTGAQAAATGSPEVRSVLVAGCWLTAGCVTEGLPLLSRDGASVSVACYAGASGGALKVIAIVGADAAIEALATIDAFGLRTAFSVGDGYFLLAAGGVLDGAGGGGVTLVRRQPPIFNPAIVVPTCPCNGTTCNVDPRTVVAFPQLAADTFVMTGTCGGAPARVWQFVMRFAAAARLAATAITGFAVDGPDSPWTVAVQVSQPPSTTSSLWVADDSDLAAYNVVQYNIALLSWPLVRTVSLAPGEAMYSLVGRYEGSMGSWVLYGTTSAALYRYDTTTADGTATVVALASGGSSRLAIRRSATRRQLRRSRPPRCRPRRSPSARRLRLRRYRRSRRRLRHRRRRRRLRTAFRTRPCCCFASATRRRRAPATARPAQCLSTRSTPQAITLRGRARR